MAVPPPFFSIGVPRALGELGAVLNWSIPTTSLRTLRGPEENIDPARACVLGLYSMVFMRWALSVMPANGLLFACHFLNTAVQGCTLGRYARIRSRQTAAAASEP